MAIFGIVYVRFLGYNIVLTKTPKNQIKEKTQKGIPSQKFVLHPWYSNVAFKPACPFGRKQKVTKSLTLLKVAFETWNFHQFIKLSLTQVVWNTHLCNVSRHQLTNRLKNGDSFRIQRGLFFLVVRNLWARWLPYIFFILTPTFFLNYE